jgi:hypothetical protein
MADRDLALVLSGGGMNGLLLELGFLQRLREDRLWERFGWIYGRSAGALGGVMAALDRLEELEGFVLALRPDVSDGETGEGDAFERVYSSRTATSEVMASAVPPQRSVPSCSRSGRRRDRHGRQPGLSPHDRAR